MENSMAVVRAEDYYFLEQENEVLQARIDKAIEYMEQDTGNGDFIELIKILKGE